MALQSNLIQQAEFTPKIKKYIFWIAAFYLLISLIGIPLLLIWLLGYGQYIARRYYENLKCKLTNKHLEFKKGIFFKVEKTIPLENIQDLTFIDNPFLKYFDLRILKIETAGQSNPEGSDMKLIGIVDSANFKEKVLSQMELQKSIDQSQNTKAEASNEKIYNTLLEIRDALNEIKDKDLK